METARYFMELLELIGIELDPSWIIILLVALVLRCKHPWNVTEEIVTEEKDGKKVSKVYRFR